MKYVLVLLVLFASSEGAAAILLDLADLAGTYAVGQNPPPGSPPTRSIQFVFPDSIAAIDGLRFVASGSFSSGQLETCREVAGITVCDTLPTYMNLTLRLSAVTTGVCHFQATATAFDVVSIHEVLLKVCEEGTTDLNQLLGTVVSAELFCDVAPETLPHIVEAAFGTLTAVELEADGAVGNQGSTWGACKAQYR